MNPDNDPLIRLWFKSTNKQLSKSPEYTWTEKLGCLFVLSHLFKFTLTLIKSLSCHLTEHMRQLSAAELCLIKQWTQTQLLLSNCLLFTCPLNQLSFMWIFPIISNVCLSFALPPTFPLNRNHSINSPWGKLKKETQLLLTRVTFCSANGLLSSCIRSWQLWHKVIEIRRFSSSRDKYLRYFLLNTTETTTPKHWR